jgi:cell division protein FtsB
VAETSDTEPGPEKVTKPGPSRKSRRISRKKYRRRRRIVWGVIIAAAAILLMGAWIGFRLWQAYHHLDAASQTVTVLSDDLRNGDGHAAQQQLAELQQHATAANSAAHDFLWSAAEHLPGLGPNLTAVRTIAGSIDSLSWGTLPPLVDLAADLQHSIAPKNGAIDLKPLYSARPEVDRAITAIGSLRGIIDGIDNSELIPQVAGAVAQLDTKLEKVTRLALTARKAVTLLPPMLGADGKRTYLVVFQNLAEPRATGGIFGAYAVITADHGRLQLVKQGATSSDIPKFDSPVLPLTPEEKALYDEKPALWPMDVNMSPDFPRAATLIREMYRKKFGVQVDGVIATDPVALSKVLAGTGPVALDGGHRLDAKTVVHYLLSQAYAAAGSSATTAEANKASDLIFASAAKATFTALVSGQGSPAKLLGGLQSAASQHRVLVWSSDAAEQKLLSSTILGGSLPTDDGAHPVVGLYLNDGGADKMGYYLRQRVDVKTVACRTDGRVVIHADMTLSSKAPRSGLPEYVTGTPDFGKYSIRTNVMVFAPTGGSVTAATVDGEQVWLAGGALNGRTVGTLTIDLKPGESKTFGVTLVSGEMPPEGLQGISLRTTPLARPAGLTVASPLECRPAA